MIRVLGSKYIIKSGTNALVCRNSGGNFRWFGTTNNDTDSKHDKDEAALQEVKEEEELQPYWKEMESRVLRKKSIRPGPGVPQGRSERRPSAWDAEEI